ncbi:putative ATPase YjoB [Cytospora mali]|nr:putative ATPase YjoB [Valsa mali var. pyri (nom. inval.)]
MADDSTTKTYFSHSSAPRVNTTELIAVSLKKQYPTLECTIIHPYSPLNLLAFASSGHGSIHPIPDEPPRQHTATSTSTSASSPGPPLPSSLALTDYSPPTRRNERGVVLHDVLFDRFLYKWNGHDFIIYIVNARDGLTGSYPEGNMTFILSTSLDPANSLVLAAGDWANDLHDEVWVFDQGGWQKSRELFESVRNANWDNVIMDPERKKAVIDDHMSFYNSRESYEKLGVPWKRGLIYYGPPGNGKTISIKAMIHQLYNLKNPIPTLYVRSLVSFYGPERSIAWIFEKARAMAPCYLILEDLDTIVTDAVKSYFFNEVDGLKSNDGIFMVGSTNHLNRLDPGISQRPSRFDRKYLFDNPTKKERVMYCQFWQNKLKDKKDVDFPDKLCEAIASITHDFSFAYMQEAFVAALLTIARMMDKHKSMLDLHDDDWVSILDCDGNDDKDDLDQYILWTEIKKQIEILRDGMGKE